MYDAMVTYFDEGSYEYKQISSYTIESNIATFNLPEGIVAMINITDRVMGIQIKPSE